MVIHKPMQKYRLLQSLKGFIILLLIITGMVAAVPKITHADASVSTQAYPSGTLGLNGWYLSNVDMTLRVTDLTYSPKKVTYWTDGGSHQQGLYPPPQNPVINPSFENGFLTETDYWDRNNPNPLQANLWRTQAEAHDGYYAIASYIYGNGTYHWSNENYAFAVIPGEQCTVSSFIKTNQIIGAGSYLEVWSKKDTGNSMVAESLKATGTQGWAQISATFVVPEDVDLLFIRLVTSAMSGATYWDSITVTTAFHEASTTFTVFSNGAHTVSYYGENTNGDIEATKTTPLKIDTLSPQFANVFGGNIITRTRFNYTFVATMNVSDTHSGIQSGSAYYRYYPSASSDWTAWQPVASANPETNGYTGNVLLTTPQVTFPLQTIGMFQFKIKDVAGNESLSLRINTSNAWVRMEGGANVIVGGEIRANALPPEDHFNADEIIYGGQTIQNFTSAKSQHVSNYDYDWQTTVLNNLEMLTIRDRATTITGGLPSVGGIYKYAGDLVIDENTITPGFENAEYSEIIVVNGDLDIRRSFQINPQSHIIWIVFGDINISGATTNVYGIFLVLGNFFSNIDNQEGIPLTVYGSVLATQKLVLTRDLGIETNDTTPSEKFVFQPAYLFDETLSRLFYGRGANWGE